MGHAMVLLNNLADKEKGADPVDRAFAGCSKLPEVCLLGRFDRSS